VSDFEDIIAGLEIDQPDDIVDVTALSIKELLKLIHEADETLMDAQQARYPTQQWARDLHSLRNAAQLEYRRRTS
jgi:hypothetical protein